MVNFSWIYFFKKKIITQDEREHIKALPTRLKRADAFLDRLLDSGPADAYGCFIEILRQHYEDIAKIVEEAKGVEISYSWFEELPDQFKQTQITDAMATRLSECLGSNWERVMLELGHSQVIIDREKQNCSKNVVRAITNLLIKWRQQQHRAATYEKLVGCLKLLNNGRSVNINFNKLENILVEENKRLGFAMKTNENSTGVSQ
ncbi:death domain-containing protein CRADD [Biomphalaria glabrata]|nr:death domain-containing protein CRADD [Biomphalaria glabrata]